MEKGDELSLRDALLILGRRWWVLLVVTALAGGLTYTLYNRQTPQYETKSVLLLDLRTAGKVAAAAGQGGSFGDTQRVMLNEVEFARSATVRDEVVRLVGATFTTEVSVSNPEADILAFTATDPDPVQAQSVANAFAAAYQALNAERTSATYVEAIAGIDAVLAPIKARLAELAPLTDPYLIDPKLPVDPTALAERRRLEADLATNEAKRTSLLLAGELDTGVPSKLITPAPLPEEPASPKPVRNGLLGALAGLVVAVAAAFLANYFDDRLRDRSSIAKATPNLPTLALIPRNRRAARSAGGLAGEPGPVGEAVRSLRASLQFAGMNTSLRSVMVTSSRPKEGKSTVAASLAVAFARNGNKTVLIDADLRRPRAHRLFGLTDNQVGLSSVMLGQSTLDKALRPAPGVDHLFVLTSGPSPANPADFLWSAGGAPGRITIDHVVAELVRFGFFVVVDVPPVLPVADALTVAQAVDGVVFVLAAGSVRRRDVGRAFELLQQAGASVSGLVVNKARNEGGGYDRAYGFSPAQASNSGPASSPGARNGASSNGHAPVPVSGSRQPSAKAQLPSQRVAPPNS